VATASTAESLPFDGLVPHWNGFFKEKMFFSYARCASCGLLYAPVFFDSDQLAALYAQMPPNMEIVPTDALRRTRRGYFETLRAHSGLAGGYVEVGPDIGLFVENCVRESRFDPYWLFEPNRAVAATLTAAMGAANFHVIDDMVGFSRAPQGSVGAVAMIQVLDHLLDPIAALRELRDRLAPEGTLIIVTHDESSILRRIFGPRWRAFCLQHPQIYSRRSMRALLARAGYDVVTIERTTNYFPVQFLVRHLLRASGLKVDSTPTFGGRSIGLKLGNMITVAAPRADESVIEVPLDSGPREP